MEKQVGIRNYEQRLRDIQEMNLTGDLLSSVVFEDLSALQDVLRIMTGIHDLAVLRAEPQRSFRNMYGHSSVSDVWAEDEENNQYNLEIQVAQNEDHLRRSRFIQSRIDSRSLGTGAGYEELPDLYLIFITERDFLHTGEGVAEIVRVIKQKGQQTDNGVHGIYANLEQPADDERKQRLLRFIKDTNNADIPTEGFENLVARVRYLKSEEGGFRFMCNVIERERAEGYAEGKEDGLREGKMEGQAAGLEKGSWLHLIRLTMRKKEKGMAAREIAELLEEDEMTIERILVAVVMSKSQDAEKVYECMDGKFSNDGANAGSVAKPEALC